MHLFALAAVSFLLGSIPFGKLMGLARGTDIQKQGSGNIGFANSLRTFGWLTALPVLAGDMAKGFIPVLYATRYFDVTAACLAALAAIAGHIFTPWLKFRGGKGVATMAGASLALNPLLAVIGLFVWAAVFLAYRVSSLSSLAFAFAMPLLALLAKSQLFYFYLLSLAVILLTHRKNIKDLLEDKETKTI